MEEWFESEAFWRDFYPYIFSAQELRDRLGWAGFGDIRLYGNLDGSPYGVQATRLVAVARRE